MKVAKNDPGLAHALASAVLKRNIERDSKWFNRHDRPSTMRALFNDLRTVFGERVIHEYVVREEGSRAEGYMAVLMPEDNCLSVALFSWAKGIAELGDLPIEVSLHVLARLIQRTVGRDVMSECCKKLRPFITGTIRAWNEAKKKGLDPRLLEGSELTVIGRDGVLIFAVENGILRGKTWLDTGMMADFNMRRTASELDADTYECRWEIAGPDPQLVH